MKNNIERTAVGMLSALAHYMESLVALRDFTRAIRCYEDNQKDLDTSDDPVAAKILYHAAKAYDASAQYNVALRLARMAQTILSRYGDVQELAETFVVIGEILRNMGELKEAERSFRDAESIFRRNDCQEGECRVLNLLAGLYYRQADYKNALSVLMDAIGLARKLNDQKKLAFMMGNIGRIYTFVGDFSEAEKHLKINIELSLKLNQTEEVARAYLALAYVYIQQSAFEQAEEALLNGQRYLADGGPLRDTIICQTYWAELKYKTGEIDVARDILQKVLREAKKNAMNATMLSRIMRHLAEVEIRAHKYQSAQRFAARAMVLLENSDNKIELGALLKIKAILADVAGKHEEARHLFIMALDIFGETGVRFEKAETLVIAGKSEAFSMRQRLTYLLRAEEFYHRNNITARLDEIEHLVTRMNLIPAHDMSILDMSDEQDAKNTEFITSHPDIIQFMKQLPAIGKSDLPVLLTGETGVGKGQMARYFHSITRPDKPFVVVSCASIPETLLESELFGYRKGAFTGAEQDKIGLFASANGGVLFLDEIGDMPLSLQAKLLGVLETRKMIPIGSTEEIELDVRLVAATNKNLEQLVESGKFRRDLYYRISGISFHIPALRTRKEDIPLLLEHFLKQSSLHATGKLPAALIHQFVDYDWPGNVRELHSKIKRLEVMANYVKDTDDIVEHARSLFAVKETQQSKSLFDRVKQFEYQLITEALLASGGNKSKAARLLGIHEATVRTKLKQFGISH